MGLSCFIEEFKLRQGVFISISWIYFSLNYFIYGGCSSIFQILGTGMDTQDTSPSVLLFFDKQRFIFNAGEVIPLLQ